MKALRASAGAAADKYADAGITEVETMEVLQLQPFDALGSVSQIIKAFGGKPAYLGAIRELERGLYQQAAN